MTGEMRPKLIGASVKRLEDPRLLTGQGTFVDDLQPRRMLHVALRRSDQAHARIMEIRTDAARHAQYTERYALYREVYPAVRDIQRQL